jgi:hypothetical protein
MNEKLYFLCTAVLAFAECWIVEIFVIRTVNMVLVIKSERTFGFIIGGGGILH